MKTIEELKEIINQPTICDAIAAIFFKADKENVPKSHAFLQYTFFKLKKEKPEFFAELVFDISGITPFSNELDEVLFRLESSTLLSTLNPAYNSYKITNTKKNLEYSYQKYKSNTADIDYCAGIFSKLIDQQLI